MATKTFEELKQLAIQIRDEKTNKQNTATRVGTAMLEHINKLEQDYYDKTTINNRTSEYNVSINHPTSGISSSNKYDLSSAIAQVPSELRTAGLKVSFLNSAGKPESWKFQGGSWAVASFIQESAGGNKILEWVTDAATTRKQVSANERKAGMQISYKPDGEDWVNEQYIGTSFTDTNWVKDENWGKIPNQDDIKELEKNIENATYFYPAEPYEIETGKYIRNDGTINSVGSGAIYKYKVPQNATIVSVSLTSGISLNSGWAAFWFVNSEGTMIQSVSIDTTGQTFENYAAFLVENTKEIWVTKGSFVSAAFNDKNINNKLREIDQEITEIEQTKVETSDNNEENLLSITDENGNILGYWDSEGYFHAKGVNSQETNQWNGKKWYAYGTSVTSSAQGKYVSYLAQFSGLIATNKGIPGGGITNLGGYSTGQVKDAIMNIDDGKLEADIISLEVGPNEGGELGTKFDIGDDTFCGCLNQCIRYLQEKTDAQIVIMSSVSTITEPSDAEEYYNRIEAIKEVCAINRVYYISGDCGLGWARIKGEDKKYTADNIHQTQLGGYILAEYMWSIIKNIPNWKLSI